MRGPLTGGPKNPSAYRSAEPKLAGDAARLGTFGTFVSTIHLLPTNSIVIPWLWYVYVYVVL